jgi:hypothetical protein
MFFSNRIDRIGVNGGLVTRKSWVVDEAGPDDRRLEVRRLDGRPLISTSRIVSSSKSGHLSRRRS